MEVIIYLISIPAIPEILKIGKLQNKTSKLG